MGRRIQIGRRLDVETRVILRLAAGYLAVFGVVIAGLSLVAYSFIAGNYRDALAPALTTPEGQRGLARALRTVAAAIVSVDAALFVVVGIASYALARAAVGSLVAARQREERFAADAAHELRTPLGAIAALAQAAQGQSTATQEAALHAITARALEAGTLVSHLLTLARSQNARSLARQPVDLAAIMARVVRERTKEAAGNGIALELQAESTVIEADEQRIVELARNLIDNALRHAHARVDLAVGRNGAYAMLHVKDDGPGVPPDLRPRLFERFSKGRDSNGSGLGLAICRWIARSHGGEIALIPPSCFEVTLPLGRYRVDDVPT